MRNNYELIALDVDGTLITDDHQVTEATKKAVRAVHEQGAHIVLCTGRAPFSTIPILKELGLSGIAITHNGGAIIDSTDNKVLHQFAYPIKDVEQIVHYCRAHGIHYDVNAANDLYVEHLTEESREMYRKFYAEPIETKDALELDIEVVKFCIFAEGAVLDQFTIDWPNFGNPDVQMIRSGEYFIDIMHPRANKGNALRVLAERLNIPSERVLAIGNYFNDVEMMEFAGLGIAMANSPDEVKAKADAVTASNNEDGVSQALMRYCLSGV